MKIKIFTSVLFMNKVEKKLERENNTTKNEIIIIGTPQTKTKKRHKYFLGLITF